MVKNGWYFDQDEIELLLPRFTGVWEVLRTLFDLPDYPLGYQRVNLPSKYYVDFDWNAVLGDDWRKATGEERERNLQTISSVRRWGSGTGWITANPGIENKYPLPDGLPVTYYYSHDETWVINGNQCTYYSPFIGYLNLKSYRREDREKMKAYGLLIQEAYDEGQLPTPLVLKEYSVRNKEEIYESIDDKWLSGNNYLLSHSITTPSYGGSNYYFNFSWHDAETGEYFVISKGRSEPKMGFYYYKDRESWIRAMKMGSTLKYLLFCRDRPLFKTLNYP